MTYFHMQQQKPDHLDVQIYIAAGWLCCGDKFLFVQKNKHAQEALKWGVAGGKIDPGETPIQGLMREIKEETQIDLDSSKIKNMTDFYAEKPGWCYGYHMFFYEFDRQPDVVLSDEHAAYQWVTLEEAGKFSLKSGGLETISLFQKLRPLE